VLSVLWRCWLGSRKCIRPVKTEWWGAGVVSCLERGADLHTAQLMPLPLTVSCFSKFQIGFTFLVPAHPGSPGQRAIKRVCMCVFQTGTPVMEANKINNNKTHTVLCNNQVITSVVRVGVCDYSWQTPRTFLFRQQSRPFGRIKSTHWPHTHTHTHV